MKQFFVLLLVAVFPLALLAQVADPTAPISDLDAIKKIMDQLTSGSLKGLALVAAIVQCLMAALRSNFVIAKIGEAGAKLRLAAVLGLSWIGGVIALQADGADWMASLVHATSLAAFQVFAHQLYSVYMEKKSK